MNGAELVSQWFGESEQALTRVFEEAREKAPAVVGGGAAGGAEKWVPGWQVFVCYNESEQPVTYNL